LNPDNLAWWEAAPFRRERRGSIARWSKELLFSGCGRDRL
jgi:hypothetical protein